MFFGSFLNNMKPVRLVADANPPILPWLLHRPWTQAWPWNYL